MNGWCFPYDVNALNQDSVAARARREGARTRMIGVTVDPTVGDGLDVLRRFGHLDEITFGRRVA